MLLVIFGLPGCGKSFAGKILQEKLGFHFYDADTDLTPEIINSIKQNQPITDKVREDYFKKVFHKVEILQKEYDKLIVTQVFMKEKHRREFKERFPKAEFILINTSDRLRLEWLGKRNHLVSKELAQKVTPEFEKPKIKHFVINNNGDSKQLEKELNLILNKISETN